MEKLCIICKNKIENGEEAIKCPDCQKEYHKKCWSEKGHCVNPECSGNKKQQESVDVSANKHEFKIGKKLLKSIKANKKRFIAFVAIFLVYTFLVSFISIISYKKYLMKEVEDSLNNLTISFEENNKKDETPEEKKLQSKSISVGQEQSVNDLFEFKVEKIEWKDKFEYLSTSNYTHEKDDIEGEKYFIVKVKVKNISGSEIDMVNYNSKCSAIFNGKYNQKADIKVEKSDNFKIKPLQETNVIYYISVTDELYKDFNKADVFLSFVNKEEKIDSWDNADSNYDSFSLSVKK